MSEPKKTSIVDLNALRKANRPKAKPQPNPSEPAPHRQGPPLAVGKVFTGGDLKSAKLQELGIEPGDVPPGFADYLAETIDSEKDLFATGLPDAIDPNKYQRPKLSQINLADLPIQKQQQIRDWVNNFRQDQSRDGEIEAQLPQTKNAQVKEALRATLKEQARFERQPPPPREQEEPQTQAPPPPPEHNHGFTSGAGGAVAATHCPRCDWELDKVDVVEITEEDKIAHRASLWDPDDRRFRKEYKLLEGTVTIGFRGLLVRERQICQRQIIIDQIKATKDNRAIPQDHLWATLMDYRMACALEYIETEKTGRLQFPELFESGIEAEDGEDTIVAPFYAAVMESGFPTEDAARVVGMAYNEFALLGEKLDMRAYDPKRK